MRNLYHFGAKLSPFRHRALLLAMLPGVLVTSLPASASDDVTLNISGTLRKTSCQLDPEYATIDIDFRTINSRDLELAETKVIPFQVRLTNCDIRATDARVTISGNPANGNTGHLALDSSSVAQGFSIGFKVGQAPSMTNLSLGTRSSALPLNAGGNTTLYFGAYAKKLPSANLVTGNFMATATLNIDYL